MHTPVLLKESLSALAIKPHGTYVDATFGRGGHSRAILAKLGQAGRLVVVDQDLAAITYAKEHFLADKRVIICHASFSDMQSVLAEHQLVHNIDGVLADLGVSSPQLDDGSRGFSFQHDGPLDMRMDQSKGESVAEWLRRVDADALAKVIWQYGEERYSRRIARAIVGAAAQNSITTTGELKAVIEACVPRSHKEKKHPATRTFQALRIFINRELEALTHFLNDAPDVLAPMGRLVVISFHSLEDRLVKQAFRSLTQKPTLPRGLPIKEQDRDDHVAFSLVAKKIKPQADELHQNTRSRSAILRAIEKLA